MKAIVNTKLVMEDGIIWNGVITYENGTIVEAGSFDDVTIPIGTALLDAHGLYTAPGLIDIHNHGHIGARFSEKPMECCEYFLRHGETTVLPTFYGDITLEQMLAGARQIRELSKSGAGRIMDGIYMEGPYMGLFGGDHKYQLWTGDISPEEYIPLVDGLKDIVRVWAIDPCRKNITDFMAYAKQQNPNVIFALGHSHATAAQCSAVQKYGVKVQTHHGDSGKAKGFAQGTIGAGCDEYTLYHPELYAELICDENGIHVAPDMVKMVVRTKGVEKIILITDSATPRGTFTNNEAEGIGYGPDICYDYEGHVAGSRITLEHACRNLMTHTGYGLCHAIRMASLNPAQMLGIDDKVGSLAAGKKANLILIDDMVHVKTVILEGEIMTENQS